MQTILNQYILLQGDDAQLSGSSDLNVLQAHSNWKNETASPTFSSRAVTLKRI